jgi:hypothetical protein
MPALLYVGEKIVASTILCLAFSSTSTLAADGVIDGRQCPSTASPTKILRLVATLQVQTGLGVCPCVDDEQINDMAEEWRLVKWTWQVIDPSDETRPLPNRMRRRSTTTYGGEAVPEDPCKVVDD